MPPDATLAEMIETISKRENDCPRRDDIDVTNALLVALTELAENRALIFRIATAIKSIQDQIGGTSHISKDGFPGYPAE